MVQQKTSRELKKRSLLLTDLGGGKGIPQRLHGEIKAGCRQRERQGMEHMPSLGSVGRVLSDSRAKTKLALRGSYISSAQGEGPGRWERLLVMRAVAESHIRNLHLLVTLQAI